jgi:hypothetical protein
MRRITLLLLIITTISFSQTFKTDNPVNDEIVVSVDTISKVVLYQRMNEWIQKNYTSPKDVIKASIKDNMIRFTGISDDIANWTIEKGQLKGTYFYGAKYTIEINFKENKYKLNYKLENLIYNNTPVNYLLTIGFGKSEKYKKRYKLDEFKIKLNKGLVNNKNKIALSIYNYLNGNIKDDW